jgi:sulfoxide reductase heme-binding subunit YedZ
VHFFIQAKANVVEPMVMGGLLLWLMMYRGLAWSGTGALARAWWAQFAITVSAAALTAEGEAIYFWLKVGVAPMRVFDANFSLWTGVRPAWVVLGIGLAAIAAGPIKASAKRWPELVAALRRAAPDNA